MSGQLIDLGSITKTMAVFLLGPFLCNGYSVKGHVWLGGQVTINSDEFNNSIVPNPKLSIANLTSELICVKSAI